MSSPQPNQEIHSGYARYQEENTSSSNSPGLLNPQNMNSAAPGINTDHIDPNVYSQKSAKYEENIPISNGSKEDLLSTHTHLLESGPLPLYKIWPSKNRFFFGGRLMAGPRADLAPNLSVWVLILAVSAVYFAVAVPYVWKEVTIILPIISIVLFLATVFFLYKTSFTDPGIIPRKNVWKLNGPIPFPYNGGEPDEALDAPNPQDEASAAIAINMEEKLNKRFCITCNIYRPPRSSHCRDCGNCVEVFDHHCPFVNNCIGKRNYRYFMGFITSLCFLGICYACGFLLMIISSIANDYSDDSNSNILDSPAVTIVIIIVLGIPTAALALVILGFCGFHIRLIIKGSTTKEKLKKIKISPDDLKKNSNNWIRTDPQLFKPRQPISPEQILKFRTDEAHDAQEALKAQQNQIQFQYPQQYPQQYHYPQRYPQQYPQQDPQQPREMPGN